MSQFLQLPGISPSILAEAKLQHIDAQTALAWCGINASGIFIPYFDSDGNPFIDQGFPFGRLRLDVPSQDGQKYHQRAGTAPHAFLTPGAVRKAAQAPFFIIIEGEKKALSLADEEGLTAIGIGGFYNFRRSDGTLVPELAYLLSVAPPDATVVFYGDRDVIFNYQFAHAATVLRPLIAPRGLYVSCLPITAPQKGIDDCKARLESEPFKSLLVQSLVNGQLVTAEHTPAALAVSLLKRKMPSDWKCPESIKGEITNDFASLIAGLHRFPLGENAMIDKAVEVTGIGRAQIKRLAKLYRQEHRPMPIRDVDLPGKVIDLSVQPGIWTRQILEVIGPRTYLYGDNLCAIEGDKFRPHNAASLVSFIDSPDCCSFLKRSSDGDVHPVQLSEKETRVVINALHQNKDVLQPVSVLSQTPVLAWTKNGSTLITGYSRETEIFAHSEQSALPSPADAVRYLIGLLQDFQFATDADKGRAISMLLTPALAKGGFLDSGRAPFFMVEKDKMGAGGGMLVKLLAAINGHRVIAITPSDPKDAREDISKHLLEGATLISLDNIRGNILTKLPFLESLLTESPFTCRAPYVHGEVGVERAVFVSTSNGAVLSPDLADRTVIIAIRKRSVNYQFLNWPEGDLIDYAKKYRGYFLNCLFSLIHDWAIRGRPAGKSISGIRFRKWTKACSWILENHFQGLPLLDDAHQTGQERLANPDFDLLRSTFRMALERGFFGPITTTDLLHLAAETGQMEIDDQKNLFRMGRALSKEFPSAREFPFAGEFLVTRQDLKDENYDIIKKYTIKPLNAHA